MKKRETNEELLKGDEQNCSSDGKKLFDASLSQIKKTYEEFYMN